MAETLYTKDGRTHVLIAPHAFSDLVRCYMGDQAGDMEATREDRLKRWEQAALGWVEMIQMQLNKTGIHPDILRNLRDQIEAEL